MRSSVRPRRCDRCPSGHGVDPFNKNQICYALTDFETAREGGAVYEPEFPVPVLYGGFGAGLPLKRLQGTLLNWIWIIFAHRDKIREWGRLKTKVESLLSLGNIGERGHVIPRCPGTEVTRTGVPRSQETAPP